MLYIYIFVRSNRCTKVFRTFAHHMDVRKLLTLNYCYCCDQRWIDFHTICADGFAWLLLSLSQLIKKRKYSSQQIGILRAVNRMDRRHDDSKWWWRYGKCSVSVCKEMKRLLLLLSSQSQKLLTRPFSRPNAILRKRKDYEFSFIKAVVLCCLVLIVDRGRSVLCQCCSQERTVPRTLFLNRCGAFLKSAVGCQLNIL